MKAPNLRDLYKAWRKDRIRAKAWKFDGPPVPLKVGQVRAELTGLQFGLQCLMALGGYKVKPLGLNDDELKQRGDSTGALCANLHIMVRCAEEVLLRHGLKEEYVQQIQQITTELNVLSTVPNQDQLAALRAVVDTIPACPKCGGKDYESTTMGGILAPDNSVTCKCGWKGFQRDLVKAGKNGKDNVRDVGEPGAEDPLGAEGVQPDSSEVPEPR
jgi:predicted nucleic-acid-binding Zn-ribbon protein